MKDILNYTLFTFKEVNFTITSFITLVAFWVGLLTFLYIVKRLIKRYDKLDKSKQYSIIALLRYFEYSGVN